MMKGLLVVAFISFIAGWADDPQAVTAGTTAPKKKVIRARFQANCTTCHNPLKDATGPALKGTLARWGGDVARIKRFIHNPAGMIAARDPYALRTYRKYRPTVMTAFPNFTDADMDALMPYLR